jgi:hypothetical protein
MADQLERLVGEYRANVLVHADFILSPDPNDKFISVQMEGYVVIREWPYTGYEKRTLPDGRVLVDLEMVESHIEGMVALSGQKIQITEKTAARNMGTLTQVYPGADFPLSFELLRRVEATTPMGVLRNEQPIVIRGILDRVPPVKQDSRFDGLNAFHTASPTPVPLLAPDGNVKAFFFSNSAFAAGGCSVIMTSAE